MVKMKNPFKFGNDAWDPENRFVTSWCLSPWALFACRALICFYAFFTTFFIIGWEAAGHDGLSIHDVHKSFSFFTILCYWGTSFYFLISSIHTFTYARHGTTTSLLHRFPRPLQALHHLFWSTITTYPLLVTIVYWGVLYSGFSTTFALWSNISQHLLNSVFGLFELFFTRINPAPWIHLVFLIVILAGYCGLAYITYATKHYFVYSFLNPNPSKTILNAQGKKENIGGFGKKGVVIAVFGIAIAIIVLFCITKGLAWTRRWATEKKLGMRGRFAQRREMRDEEMEMESQGIVDKSGS